MTVKQWNEMKQPDWSKKATAEANAKPADPQPSATAPPDANAPAVDPLAGVRGALDMPDATEEEIVARIGELRTPKPDAPNA